MSLVLFTMITVWYVWPKFKTMNLYDVLTIIMVVFGFRYLGTFFSVTSFTNGLSPEFYNIASWADLVISIIALITAFVLRKKSSVGVGLSWLVVILSTVDFGSNVPKISSLHVADTIGPLMPLMTVLGPLWMVTTVLLWYILIKKPLQR